MSQALQQLADAFTDLLRIPDQDAARVSKPPHTAVTSVEKHHNSQVLHIDFERVCDMTLDDWHLLCARAYNRASVSPSEVSASLKYSNVLVLVLSLAGQ